MWCGVRKRLCWIPSDIATLERPITPAFKKSRWGILFFFRSDKLDFRSKVRGEGTLGSGVNWSVSWQMTISENKPGRTPPLSFFLSPLLPRSPIDTFGLHNDNRVGDLPNLGLGFGLR